MENWPIRSCCWITLDRQGFLQATILEESTSILIEGFKLSRSFTLVACPIETLKETTASWLLETSNGCRPRPGWSMKKNTRQSSQKQEESLKSSSCG